MKIEKKIWPEYFEAIKQGRKNFELRLGDFKINPGDKFVLRGWDQERNQYTGRELIKKVTYVLKTNDIDFWDKKEIEKYGYQIISFK